MGVQCCICGRKGGQVTLLHKNEIKSISPERLDWTPEIGVYFNWNSKGTDSGVIIFNSEHGISRYFQRLNLLESRDLLPTFAWRRVSNNQIWVLTDTLELKREKERYSQLIWVGITVWLEKIFWWRGLKNSKGKGMSSKVSSLDRKTNFPTPSNTYNKLAMCEVMVRIFAGHDSET